MGNSVKLLGYVFYIGLALLLMSCGGGGDEGGGVFHCTYTKTSYYSGSGCSSPSVTVTECVEEYADNIRDDWTPEYYCYQIYSGNDNYCSSTCCVDVYYTNTTYGSGSCPASVSLSAKLNNSSQIIYKLSWNGYADLDLTILTPNKNNVTAESGIVDGCQHGGNSYGIEESNSEEITCGPDADQTKEYLLTATSFSTEPIQYTVDVIKGSEIAQTIQGTLEPTKPEIVISSNL